MTGSTSPFCFFGFGDTGFRRRRIFGDHRREPTVFVCVTNLRVAAGDLLLGSARGVEDRRSELLTSFAAQFIAAFGKRRDHPMEARFEPFAAHFPRRAETYGTFATRKRHRNSFGAALLRAGFFEGRDLRE